MFGIAAHTTDNIHPTFLQFSVGADGKKMEPESNVLLASIENMQYAVTLDVLHTVATFKHWKHSALVVCSFLTLILFCALGLFSIWTCPKNRHVR